MIRINLSTLLGKKRWDTSRPCKTHWYSSQYHQRPLPWDDWQGKPGASGSDLRSTGVRTIRADRTCSKWSLFTGICEGKEVQESALTSALKLPFGFRMVSLTGYLLQCKISTVDLLDWQTHFQGACVYRRLFSLSAFLIIANKIKGGKQFCVAPCAEVHSDSDCHGIAYRKRGGTSWNNLSHKGLREIHAFGMRCQSQHRGLGLDLWWTQPR